jgi:RHS repeat-associated protein
MPEGTGSTRTSDYVYLASAVLGTGGGQMVAQHDNFANLTRTNCVHKDHRGSTRLLTKLDKSPLETPYDYLPFGEPIGPSGSGTTHKFTGKERDPESSLDNFGARYYWAGIGRFLAVDPSMLSVLLQNPQTWNRYPYTLNNPLRFVDPTGELWVESGNKDNPYTWVDTCPAVVCSPFLVQS